MTDFHSHILPGLDDGSRSIPESVRMLEMEKEQGVNEVVLTPHFYADRDRIGSYLEAREKSLQSLLEALPEDMPELYLGAEVAYFPRMGEADALSELAIRGTGTILVELPFSQWDEEVCRDLDTMIGRRGLRVILAHLERYTEFQKKRKVLDEILQMPVYVQLNAGPFSTFFGRRYPMQLVKSGRAVLLGSDCHNTDDRAPNLKAGRDMIAAKADRDALARIDTVGRLILNNGVCYKR